MEEGKYSARLVALAAEALATCVWGEAHLILQRYFPGEKALMVPHDISKAEKTARALDHFKALRRRGIPIPGWPDQFVDDVAEECFSEADLQDASVAESLPKGRRRFLNALRGEGWDVRDGRIVPALMATAEVAETESLLLEKLASLGWQVATRHLRSAQRTYENSIWTSCNSELRSFLQEVCDQIALRRYPEEAEAKAPGGERRMLLESLGFLSEQEGDFLKYLFKMLHTEGAHPGISDERTARLRRIVVETMALYLIEKLEGST